jgi:hypothetical protein
VLSGGGALVLSFSLAPHRLSAQGAQNAGVQPIPEPPLPGSLKSEPMLDSWIRIDADGTITVFTGKAELGQGLKTALIQLAAEELVVEPPSVHLVTADTSRTPNEGYTAGSHPMQDSGTAIMNAAAQVRAILIEEAAAQLQLTRPGWRTAMRTVLPVRRSSATRWRPMKPVPPNTVIVPAMTYFLSIAQRSPERCIIGTDQSCSKGFEHCATVPILY